MRRKIRMASGRMFPLLVLLIIISPTMARPGNVRIMEFHYEEQQGRADFSLTTDFTKIGYYPDYRFQPELGYTLLILDIADSQLFSLRFLSPARIYIHEYNESEISGGLTIFSNTDFALTLPTFSEEDKIVILDEGNNVVFSKPISAAAAGEGKSWARAVPALFRWAALLLCLIAIFLVSRKIRRLRQ